MGNKGKSVILKTQLGMGRFADANLLRRMNIDEYLNSVVDHFGKIENNYYALNEYYGGNIPKRIEDSFKVYPYYDYILENLNTHRADELFRKIRCLFSQLEIKDISFDGNDKKYIKTKWSDFDFERESYEIEDIIRNSEEFKHLLEFYGYSLSKIVSDEVHRCVYVNIEPIYGESANVFVYKECKGKLYHITDAENEKKILQSGLRMKNASAKGNPYRNFPNRVYMIGIPSCRFPLKSDIMIDSVLSYNDTENITIFEIDVSGLHIDFYKDSVSDSQNMRFAVYCYSNIPASTIKPIFSGNYLNLIK